MRFLISPVGSVQIMTARAANNRTRAHAVSLLLAFLAAGCGNGDRGAGSREIDGAPGAVGDDVIASTSEDVFSIGGADGEAWESFTAVTDAVFDAMGNLIVLDNLQRRVVVVAPDGSRHRELSRAGEGPGEFRFPLALAAMHDGRLVVYDHAHKSFLAYRPDGSFSEQFRIDDEDPAIGQAPRSTSLIGKRFRSLPDGRLLAFGGFGTGPGRPIEIIGLGAGTDTLAVAWDIATATGPETREIPALAANTANTVYSHGTTRPHFAPPLLADVLSDGRVAVVDSVGYRIKLLSASGAIASVIERSIQPRDVTPAIRQSVRDAQAEKLAKNAGVATEGVTVMSSGLSKEMIDALLREAFESDLRELTFAERIPVIAAMAVDSEDRIWVARTGKDEGADGPTDIFASGGDYMGTLAADDLRIPTAFGPGGLMAYVEKDEFDAPVVRVIRLLRLAAPGAPSS